MLKRILFVFFVISVSFSYAQKINWVSFNEALELQKESPKKIIMDVYTNWCGPCKMLDRNTFQNKDVANFVNANYYAVKFNAEGDDKVAYAGQDFSNPNYDPSLSKRRNSTHQFSRYLQVSAYPTIVFFDEDAQVITPIKGYQNPQQIELYLKIFKDDAYKNIKSQEDFNKFYETFKPEFKS